ncbi:PREDICTED: CMRF35-like molecule 4 [Chrysochloris asiatica]|uniref:CMRF35-like molecule 4 n=1 Tax=Chrysochloris asiatica TaxID=185453 RepID=A0A9B0WWE8_CHRAS|nr:PREDICTED: CMRF35-like molecule 4 [Chrysochloris asiatica]
MDLYFSDCSTLRGPNAVRGLNGGSLTVQCQYGPGYQTYIKWWCRGAEWVSCNKFVKTTGSEQEVTKSRVSIRDNHKNRIFTVTMENLREDDEDIYWCGIERTGVDLGLKVKVSVDPDSSSESSGRTMPSMTRQETAAPRQHLKFSSIHFLLLVLLKVPLFLSMLGAVLWVNRSQRVPVWGGWVIPHMRTSSSGVQDALSTKTNSQVESG